MRKTLFYIFLLQGVSSFAQDSLPSSKNGEHAVSGKNLVQVGSSRKWVVGGGTAAVYGASFIYLNEAWYKGYPRSSFHSFNDSREWMQVDKIGHAWSAYSTSKATAALWKWAGVHDNQAVLLGSGGSLLYMLAIEYLDGRSAEWGWSWADVAADFTGSILFAAQELGWKEQRIILKFSSHKIKYGSLLNSRADELFGKSLPERLLKDYNAQTYWLSFSVNSFLKNKNFPDWLNISFGYGAGGMLGGHENIAYDKNGNLTFDRRDIQRYRQWYLSPDIDLTKIKTNSKFLRTAFFVLNSFKIPAPALELSKGRLRGRWMQF